jgi:hypothetical protein
MKIIDPREEETHHIGAKTALLTYELWIFGLAKKTALARVTVPA